MGVLALIPHLPTNEAAPLNRPGVVQWRIVFVRMSHDPRTKAYVAKRTAEGKTAKEWSALFFPDSYLIAMSCRGLPVQVLVVDLLRGLVSECRVETLSIVAKFNVPGNVFSGVFAGGVNGAVDPFDLHGGVERFG